LKTGSYVIKVSTSLSHLQHSTSTVCGHSFSHTNSQTGFGHSGFTQFQSQTGSSQIASHSGSGTYGNYIGIDINYFAMRNTLRSIADILTLFTIWSSTRFFRTFYLAFGLFTFNITKSILGFLTCCMALWCFTNWIANGFTMRTITFPRAFRMAFNCVSGNYLRIRNSDDNEKDGEF